MEGWKIVAARRAVARMVDTLGPDDRFEVVTFSSYMNFLGGEAGVLVPASDQNRFRALEFLTRAIADGGTETVPAVKQAMALLQPAPQTRDAIVFLVTDGQVGNEDGLVRMVGKGSGACRFQILGIDEAINDGLLKRLADNTGGWFLAAERAERLDAVLLEASRRFGGPVVTDICLQAPGLQWVKDALVSSGSLDLYPGTPLVLLGRCKHVPESLSVTGTGTLEGFSRILPLEICQEQALRKVWARWRVRDLEDRLVREPKEGMVRKQLVAISLAHGVLCRFTAFLAVDDAAVVNPEGRLETILQPVEAPRGWATGAVFCFSMARIDQRCSILGGGKRSGLNSTLDSMLDVICPPSPGIMQHSSSAPAGPNVEEKPMQAAASSASILLEYLESLGPIVAHTTGSLEFPERFFDLLRLLKGKTFRQFLAAQNLRKVLRDAKSWHQIPFQGRQQLIRALVSEIMAALRVFLEACAAEGSPVATKGGRTFWAP